MRLTRFSLRLAVGTFAILGSSCSSNAPSQDEDGPPSVGGVASGGDLATGGDGTESGGATTGGNAWGGLGGGGLGGAGASSGGVTSTGGTDLGGSGSGGSPPTGGVATGGVSESGGVPASGGTADFGGTPSSGGTAGTGGSSDSGGSASTGGTPDSGGTSTGGAGDVCPARPGAPPGTLPLPSPSQLSYQRTEMTAFIHYSMATYDGSEQGNPSDPATMFNPTGLDADTGVTQWTSSLRAAGFRQAMLVAKHSVGFCLWPSEYTDYTIAASPWLGGEGDIVQLFTDAMHADDMRVALYLSPWDQKYTSSDPGYETHFKNQLTELLAYGPAYEIEFDGYNAPTSNVDWVSVFQHVKAQQPDILIWAGPEITNTGATPDLQWIGNENGQATRSTSSLDTRNCGNGDTWCPYECNVSSHRPRWFWHPNESPMSLSDMQQIYFRTVGMNCTLNFNVPPSQTGEFDQLDVTLLQEFGEWYSSLYETNLVEGQPVTADSTWENEGFEASQAVDDDLCTYWAAASGTTSTRLEITPASPITGSLISIREAIELGERVTGYHVEIKQSGAWSAATDDSGTDVQGTVVGQRQLWRLGSQTIEAIALVIDSAKAPPAIAEFGVY